MAVDIFKKFSWDLDPNSVNKSNWLCLMEIEEKLENVKSPYRNHKTDLFKKYRLCSFIRIYPQEF